MWSLETGVNEDIGLNHDELSKNKSIYRSSFEVKRLKMQKNQQKVR